MENKKNATINEFSQAVLSCCQEKLGKNYILFLQDIRKNNGVTYKGLAIRKDESRIAPTIYLNDLFSDYLKNKITVEDAADVAISIYEKGESQEDAVDVKNFLDFNSVRPQIFYRLVNAKRNEELLEGVPHILFKDLAIVFVVSVEVNCNGVGSFLIHNSHAERWGTDAEALYEIARENTPRLQPYKLTNMVGILQELGNIKPDEEYSEEMSKCPMYVLTNEKNVYGAAAILYPGVLKNFASILRQNIYILPSSINEVILLPEDIGARIYTDELLSMVRSVNDETVKTEDILSYSVYYYDREKDSISVFF